MTQLLTVRELAQALRYSETRVRHLVASGALPALRVAPGASIRFDPDAIREAMKTGGVGKPTNGAHE